MKHLLLAGATAFALAVAAPALAAPQELEHDSGMSGMHHESGKLESGMHHEFSSEDMAAFTDARIAALKAGLKLSAAQEKSWPTLEAALRDMAKSRAERVAEWRDHGKEAHEHRDALDMLRRRAAMMTSRATELSKLADAAKPLYDSLDDAQKNRFGMLMRNAVGGMRGHFSQFGWRHHGMRDSDG